ncbi:MAG TPA: 2-nitropropane dioxygenase, partial [Geobacteraceae bacterium]|nr:2-nitropropane dioxygenase [Geobacteraceae bacterium]
MAGQPAEQACLGWWQPADTLPYLSEKSVKEELRRVRLPLYMVERNGSLVPESGGTALFGAGQAEGFPLRAYAPPCPPEQMGDPDFCSELGLRFPYLGGSMAKGISSVAMVEALGHAGMLGFFGAAGLPLAEVEAAVDRLAGSLGGTPHGFNLIHSPHEPDLENELANLFIRKGVPLVEASAFLDLTLPLVRYGVHGIHRRPDGKIITPNRIIAKVSREELAAKFLSPPPDSLLRELAAGGEITAEQ